MKEWYLSYNTNGYLYNVSNKILIKCLITSNKENEITLLTDKENIAIIYNFFNLSNCNVCQLIPNLYCESKDNKNKIIFNYINFRNLRTVDSILYINISYKELIRNKGFKQFDVEPKKEDIIELHQASVSQLFSELFIRFKGLFIK